MLALLAGAICPTALAIPDDLYGGVMIAHYVPEIAYSAAPPAGGWCAAYEPYAIGDLEQVNAQVFTPDALGLIWYVIAAWELEDKTWCGTEFGLASYDPAVFVFTEAEPCFPAAGLELPTPGWPGPGEGTAFVVTGDPWGGNWVPVYACRGYAYGYGAQTVIPLAPDPATGFVGFTNCVLPPRPFAVATEQRGALGINTQGTVPAWPASSIWACCFPSGDCLMLSWYECESAGGVWHEGIDCDSDNPCVPVTGACCMGGYCEEWIREICDLHGGSWYGPQTDCDPNPCEAVCCFETECVITLEAICRAGGGNWHPEWTSCERGRSVCWPTPARDVSWGTIKRVFE
jgi:hypothetical protein